MSKDGLKRTDFRVTHRVGGSDFVNILCLVHREHDTEDDGPLPDLSCSAILKGIRAQMANNADASNWWQDDVDDDWVEELTEWAEELVRRRFPEFY